MSAPIITWWKETTPGNFAEVTGTYDFGVIDAGGGKQANATFYIWNTKGSADVAVSDITNCYITTKKLDGTNPAAPADNDLVYEKWVNAKALSSGDATFTAIGGPAAGVVNRPVSGQGAPAGTVIGGTNTGDPELAGNLTHFGKVEVCIEPPANASAGRIDFLLRFGYEYV